MANNSTYNMACVKRARVRSYGLSVCGSAGVGFSCRQPSLTSASPSMVMPTDLWRASMASFFMPSGRSPASAARVTCTMISATMSQCSSWATAPQRCVVFRMTMPLSLCA